MQAEMQLSLLWLFHFGSCTSGRPRRVATVYNLSPRVSTSGFGALNSGRITTVASLMTTDGLWYGVERSPRVTIRRMWTELSTSGSD